MTNEIYLLIFITAVCGLLMVCGAFLLLYRGIIKLESPGENATATEITIYSVLKLKTNIAALVLFFIGFAFLWLGFRHAEWRPPSLEIRGKILNVKPNEFVTVSLCGGPWPLPVQNEGKQIFEFDDWVTPTLDQFQLQIGKVGLLPEITYGLMRKRSTGNAKEISKIVFIQGNLASLDPISLNEPAPPPPPLVDKVTNAPVPKVNYAAEN